jgi:hypothetical protein
MEATTQAEALMILQTHAALTRCSSTISHALSFPHLLAAS